MSEKIWLDRKIGFHNTFYTISISVTIDSIGPSIILRSIYDHGGSYAREFSSGEELLPFGC